MAWAQLHAQYPPFEKSERTTNIRNSHNFSVLPVPPHPLFRPYERGTFRPSDRQFYGDDIVDHGNDANVNNRGMAWAHQQKLLRMKAELLAKAQEDAANGAAAPNAADAGVGVAGVRGDAARSLNEHRDGFPTYSHSRIPEAGNGAPPYEGTTSAAAGNLPYSSAAGDLEALRKDAQQPAPNGGGGYKTPEGGIPRVPFNGTSHHAAQQHASPRYSMKHERNTGYMSQQQQAGHNDAAGGMGAPAAWHQPQQRLVGIGLAPETLLPSRQNRPLPFASTSSTHSPRVEPQQWYAATPSPSASRNMSEIGDGWLYSGPAAGSVEFGAAGSSAASLLGFSSLTPMSTSGNEKSVSLGYCSVTSSSSNAAVEAAASEAYARQQAVLPGDVYAEAQLRVNDRDERNGNVSSVDELLLNDDDRREVPELYQGESDTDDMSFFSLNHNSASSNGEEDDENMRSLAASLLH